MKGNGQVGIRFKAQEVNRQQNEVIVYKYKQKIVYKQVAIQLYRQVFET